PAQSPFRSLAVVYLDRTRDAVAVLPHPREALRHDSEHLTPVAFEDCPHGVETVVHSALVHDLQRPGHVLADALPLTEGRHAEFQQHHRARPFLRGDWSPFFCLSDTPLRPRKPGHRI